MRATGLWLLAPMAMAGAAPVAAGSLRVMPIRVEVPENARFCGLTVANDEDTPVSVQVRGYRWSKDANGEDVLAEDAAFQVNPTIVTLGAREERLVRCGMPPSGPRTPSGVAEQSWRLVLDELPRPDAAPGSTSRPGGIRTLLRISVPVFRAAAEAQPNLVWSLGSDAAGRPVLVIENDGARHAQVLSLELEPVRAGQAPGTVTKSFYILAGGRTALPLPAGFEGVPGAVRAKTPDGPLDLRPRAGP
ncbi:fimbrial chaperone protein [Novosphingobium sp. PhB165]|uniref:fimbrial biogenesis chaperone n=1 Tax=Novosphingobium sp. PhB165 TaxID=2485105 RepID=UPI00104E582C|nr:fimbria/pilus periplasmic chaperone [Novosphingobium sp. PhB165]TCM19653.1 fimbrial chaperone protein [Novosphingobium sp. PhB165]